MRAITVRDRDAGVAGLTLTDMPYPQAAENDVIVRVHAAGFTPGELDWPATWSDADVCLGHLPGVVSLLLRPEGSRRPFLAAAVEVVGRIPRPAVTA